MANIAPADSQDQYHPLRQIGGSLSDACQAGQPHDQRRQTEQSNGDISTIDHQAANPLPKVVPLGLEDEMFVPQKGERDTDQRCEWAGEQVSVSEVVGQSPLENRETPIAKEGIHAPNNEILQLVAR